MNTNRFNEEYIGKKVLVQTNEQDTDLIKAEIIRYEITGCNKNIKLIIFKDEHGKEFFCGGAIYPDTPEFRRVLALATEMFPNVKEKFEFLKELRNFDRNMDYILDNSN